MVGTFFGAFLTITILASLILLALRWRALKDVRPIGSLVTTQGVFLGGNMLLVAMMLITLLGHVPRHYPHLHRKRTQRDAVLYNRGVLPLSMLLIALMAISPLLTGRRQVMKKLTRNLGLPLVMAAIALGVLWSMKVHRAWALAAGIVAQRCSGRSRSIFLPVFAPGNRTRTRAWQLRRCDSWTRTTADTAATSSTRASS